MLRRRAYRGRCERLSPALEAISGEVEVPVQLKHKEYFRNKRDPVFQEIGLLTPVDRPAPA